MCNTALIIIYYPAHVHISPSTPTPLNRQAQAAPQSQPANQKISQSQYTLHIYTKRQSISPTPTHTDQQQVSNG